MAYMYRYDPTGFTDEAASHQNIISRIRDNDRRSPALIRPATASGWRPSLSSSSEKKNKQHDKMSASSAVHQLSLLTLAPAAAAATFSSLPRPALAGRFDPKTGETSSNTTSHYQSPSYLQQQQQQELERRQRHRTETASLRNSAYPNDDEHDSRRTPTVSKVARNSDSGSVNYFNDQTTDHRYAASPAAGDTLASVVYYRSKSNNDAVVVALVDGERDFKQSVRPLCTTGVHHAVQQRTQNFTSSGRHNKLTSSTAAADSSPHYHHYRFAQVDSNNNSDSSSTILNAESLAIINDIGDRKRSFFGTTFDNEKLYGLGQRHQQQQQQQVDSGAGILDNKQRRMQRDCIMLSDSSSGVGNSNSNLKSTDVSNNHLPSKTVNNDTKVVAQAPPTPPPLPQQQRQQPNFNRIQTAQQARFSPTTSRPTSIQPKFYENIGHDNFRAQNDSTANTRLNFSRQEHQYNNTTVQKKSSSSSSNSSVVIHVEASQHHQQVVSTDLDAPTDGERTSRSTSASRPPTLPVKTAKLLALQQKYKTTSVNSANVLQQATLAITPASSIFEVPPRIARPHVQAKENHQHRRRMTTTIDVEHLFRLAQQQQQTASVDSTSSLKNKLDGCTSAISLSESSSAASTTSTLTAGFRQQSEPGSEVMYQIAGGSRMPTMANHFETTQTSCAFENDDSNNSSKQHGRSGGYWRRSAQFPPQTTTYAQSSISAQLLQDAATNSVNNNVATDAVFVDATNAVLMATRAAAVGQHRFHSTNSARAYADTTNLPTVRRLVQLVEMHQYHEGVKLIAQMQQGHFSAIVLELPLDTWIAHYPRSLPLLDAVYARVASLDHNDQLVPDLRRRLHIQPLLFHIVKFYATHLHAKYPSVKQREPIRLYDMQAVDNDTRSLLRWLYKIDSRLTTFLKRKKKALEDALQSLGEHGLIHCVQEGEDLFYSLSDALRKELDRIITAAKVAVETADCVEPAMKPMKPATLTKKSLAKRVANRDSLMHKRSGSSKRSGPGPSEQSHQHMLQLKYDEIQSRVKRNSRLLQTLHPIKQIQDMLNLLMSTLQRRINNDEVVLSQMSELKKGYQFDPHTNVADTLKMFIAGCDSVLYMLQTLNGIDKVDTGSLVISINRESDQLSGSTSVASSANQLQHPASSSSLSKTANVRMFGDSRTNSYTAADICTYFDNQSPSPPTMSSSAGAAQQQQVVAMRPQHLLYSAAASSASSISPAPDAQARSCIEQQTKSSSRTPTSGVSSSSGVISGEGNDGSSPCNSSSAGSSSSHSPVMTSSVQNTSSALQTVNIYSSTTTPPAIESETKKRPDVVGDGAPSEVSGYQSGHSSPVTSAKSGEINGPLDGGRSSSNNAEAETVMKLDKQETDSNSDSTSRNNNVRSKNANYEQKSEIDPYAYNPFHQKSPSIASKTGITVNGCAVTSTPPTVSSSMGTSLLPATAHYTSTPETSKQTDERADLIDNRDDGSEDTNIANVHLQVRQQYEQLYKYARDEVRNQLDLNDISSTNEENEELKNKLIFSVMVLAFRSVESSIAQARRAAAVSSVAANHSCISGDRNVPAADDCSAQRAFPDSFVRRLDKHDLQINIEEIKTHLHSTLYDFPHLLSSAELANFITRCVKTVWSICVRTIYTPSQNLSICSSTSSSSYHLDYDKSLFDDDLHCRALGSDESSKLIKNYLWPSLVVACASSCSISGNGKISEAADADEQVVECIFRGIVLT